MAGRVLFGGGILMGNSESCGFAGTFGNCQDQFRKNAENIDRLNEYTSVLTDHLLEVGSDAKEKFLLISSELEEIQKIKENLEKSKRKLENYTKKFEVNEKTFICSRMYTNVVLKPAAEFQF